MPTVAHRAGEAARVCDIPQNWDPAGGDLEIVGQPGAGECGAAAAGRGVGVCESDLEYTAEDPGQRGERGALASG